MFQPCPDGQREEPWNNHRHQISPDLMMADRSDKPPILRVLILLVALVGVALALAALSPQTQESVTSSADGGVATADPAPSTRP